MQVNSLHPLTRYRLLRIISTRADDMMRQLDIQTVRELEEYAEGTVSQLLYLQVCCLQVQPGLQGRPACCCQVHRLQSQQHLPAERALPVTGVRWLRVSAGCKLQRSSQASSVSNLHFVQQPHACLHIMWLSYP